MGPLGLYFGWAFDVDYRRSEYHLNKTCLAASLVATNNLENLERKYRVALQWSRSIGGGLPSYQKKTMESFLSKPEEMWGRVQNSVVFGTGYTGENQEIKLVPVATAPPEQQSNPWPAPSSVLEVASHDLRFPAVTMADKT